MSIFKKKAGYNGHSLQYPPNNMLHEHTHEEGTMDNTSFDEVTPPQRSISNTHLPAMEEFPIQAQASVQVPVPTPVEAPVQAPLQAPVQLPAQELVQTRVQVPVQAPVQMQVQVPTPAPVQPMIQPETPAPIPTTSPDVLWQPAQQTEVVQVQREDQVQVQPQPSVQPVVNQTPVQVQVPPQPQLIPSLGVQPQAPEVPKSARKAPGTCEDGLIGLTVRIDPVLYARVKRTAKGYNVKLAKIVEALIRDYCPER